MATPTPLNIGDRFTKGGVTYQITAVDSLAGLTHLVAAMVRAHKEPRQYHAGNVLKNGTLGVRGGVWIRNARTGNMVQL